MPKVKCDRTTGADGSVAVDLVFAVPGQPAWDFEVGASSVPGKAFDHPISISTTAHSIDDPYSGAADFLDSTGATGSGWTVGGPHGVLLPGTIVVNADLSGSIGAPMKGVQPGDQLPDIHVVGHWSC
jgi:hypothetical protein